MILKLSEHGHSVTRGCIFLSQLKIAAFLWWARARRSASVLKQLVRCRFGFAGVGDGNTEKQSSSRSADPSSLSLLCCVKCRTQWWGSLLKILSVLGWSSKCCFLWFMLGIVAEPPREILCCWQAAAPASPMRTMKMKNLSWCVPVSPKRTMKMKNLSRCVLVSPMRTIII